MMSLALAPTLPILPLALILAAMAMVVAGDDGDGDGGGGRWWWRFSFYKNLFFDNLGWGASCSYKPPAARCSH
jgi:hypothetical protein